MRELVDGESAVRQVISEEVVRCRLACVHHRLPPEAWAPRKSHDHRQVAGVEGHVDLTFGFILHGEGHESAPLRPVRLSRMMTMPMQLF